MRLLFPSTVAEEPSTQKTIKSLKRLCPQVFVVAAVVWAEPNDDDDDVWIYKSFQISFRAKMKFDLIWDQLIC